MTATPNNKGCSESEEVSPAWARTRGESPIITEKEKETENETEAKGT